MRFVLWDIDHTLMNATWRDGLLPKVGGSWTEYHEAAVSDKPHENAVQLCRGMASIGYQCLGITMRPEKWRAMTKAQMITHGIPLLDVMMNPLDRHSDTVMTKITLILEHFNEVQRKDIAFYIDDRADCCEAVVAKFGISTLQIRHLTRS